MIRTTDSGSAIIIGGGIIGCSIALELQRAGLQCTVLDKGPLLQEASTAAAGMLGAQVEIHHPGAFYELCRYSQRIYSEWTDELEEISGLSPQYISEGIIRIAYNEEDEQELRSRLSWMKDAEWVDTATIRDLEPRVALGERGGLYFRKDHQIHPVHTAKALEAALHREGCIIRAWTPVFHLIEKNGRVCGVKTAEGELYADHVIIAAGAWSSALTEPYGLPLPLFPVKGQCISVRLQAPIINRTIFTKGCYIVPKMDGSLLIGASQLEAGYDKRTHISVVSDLYARAAELLPELAEAELMSTWAGLRPGTRDELPFIGASSRMPGVIVAAGHYRNGILLAPATAKLVKQMVHGEALDVDVTAFAPDRVLHPASTI